MAWLHPVLKFLPSGTYWSGMNCLNIMCDPMKICHLCTVGVSGVWIVSACCMVLWSVVWSVWVHGSYYGLDGFNLWCVSNVILWVLWLFFIFCNIFPVITHERVLFSGAYPHYLIVSMIPSDWESKGSNRFGASCPKMEVQPAYET
jgi:hypothetical protein